MKRVFRRLNVVKETEDEHKAKKLLEAGYTEITPTKRSQKKKAEAPKAEAGEEHGTGGEAEDSAESEGDGT